MLLLIPVVLYIFALTFLYGLLIVRFLERLLPSSTSREVPLPIIHITGMVALAVIAGYMSLVFRIGLLANAIVFTIVLIFSVINRHDVLHATRRYLCSVRTQHPFVLVLVVLFCAMVLIESAAQPKFVDSGLYHVQTIKWLEDYGVVPGLGNLHGMYAWNSMWYPLAALFGFSFLGVETLHIANGMLFIFATCFFLGGLAAIWKGASSPASIIKVAAIPFGLFAYKYQLGSPATDMPAALLLWVAFILCLEYPYSNQTIDSRMPNLIAVGVGLYLCTMKLSVLPILLLCGYLFYLQFKRRMHREMWLEAGLGLIILVPWAVRNVILSGYLVFPFPYIDLFNVDWKVPYKYVVEEKLVAHGWARMPGSHWSESLEMLPWEWLPNWVHEAGYKYVSVIVASFALMVACAPITLVGWRPRTGLTTRGVLYLIACVGLMYWFTNAPDPRFGWGFIFLGIALPMVRPMETFLGRFRWTSRVCMVTAVILYASMQEYGSIRTAPRFGEMVWSPVAYPREELWSEVMGHVVVNGARTGLCWDSPLPCTPIIKDHLRPRGDSLGSGFRVVETEDVR